MAETSIPIKEVVKYELSGDKIGLKAYFDEDDYYHIHSDELSPLEKWIHQLLLKSGIPVGLRIYYDGEICMEMDVAIEEVLKSFGYHRWASGYNLQTNKRDLAFDKDEQARGD